MKRKQITAIAGLLTATTLLLTACARDSATTGNTTAPTNAPTTQATQPPADGQTSGDQVTNEPAALDVITLRTSTKKNCTSTPWVVGESQGIFAKHGIAIEYTGEIDDIYPTIVNGTNDIGVDSPGGIALKLAEEAEIIGVGFNQVDPDGDSVDRKYQHMKFFVSPDLGHHLD